MIPILSEVCLANLGYSCQELDIHSGAAIPVIDATAQAPGMASEQSGLCFSTCKEIEGTTPAVPFSESHFLPTSQQCWPPRFTKFTSGRCTMARTVQKEHWSSAIWGPLTCWTVVFSRKPRRMSNIPLKQLVPLLHYKLVPSFICSLHVPPVEANISTGQGWPAFKEIAT